MATTKMQKALDLFEKCDLPELESINKSLEEKILEKISQREKEIQEELAQLSKSKTEINA